MVSTYQKERILATRKILIIAVIFVLFSTMTLAQNSSQTEPKMSKGQINELITAFSRNVKMDGVKLSFMLLNNKTVDAMFQGDSRYAMRARANSATTFFIQGVTDKLISLNPKYEVEQNGKTFKGEAINMKNLQTGWVASGTTITGLFRLSEKIDVTQPFKIKGDQISSTDFELTEDAIKLLSN